MFDNSIVPVSDDSEHTLRAARKASGRGSCSLARVEAPARLLAVDAKKPDIRRLIV